MNKKKGLQVLDSLQCLSQQKIISAIEKNAIANSVAVAMKTGDYSDVVKKLKNTSCLIRGREDFIDTTIRTAEGERNE